MDPSLNRHFASAATSTPGCVKGNRGEVRGAKPRREAAVSLFQNYYRDHGLCDIASRYCMYIQFTPQRPDQTKLLYRVASTLGDVCYELLLMNRCHSNDRKK